MLAAAVALGQPAEPAKTATGIATEQAIAEVVDRVAQRSDAVAIPLTAALEAIARREGPPGPATP